MLRERMRHAFVSKDCYVSMGEFETLDINLLWILPNFLECLNHWQQEVLSSFSISIFLLKYMYI